MRRVNTRGIKAANKCMLMAACAYNLKKLLKRMKEVGPEVKKFLKISAKMTLQLLFVSWPLIFFNHRKNLQLQLTNT
jgi:hypothetical protein